MHQERYHGLDCIRAGAMLLGLVLHVCIFFMPSEMYGWVSGEYYGDPFNLALDNFIHLFRMQLFFMMAGFFAELVIVRKGMEYIVRDRLKRIVIPFVVGILLFMPIHFFIVNVPDVIPHATLSEMTAFEHFAALQLWGIFSEESIARHDWLIHYWFLYYLLFFYGLHFGLRNVVISLNLTKHDLLDSFIHAAVSHKYGIVLLGLVSFPFQYSLTSVTFPVGGYNVSISTLVFYFMFYLFGALLYKNRHLLERMKLHGWFYLCVSIPFFIYILEPSQRVDGASTVIRDITSWKILDFNLWYEGIFHGGWNKVLVAFVRGQLCWLMCFAFIGIAQNYLNKPTPLVRYLADSSYWIYWIHLPVTFALSSWAQGLDFANSLTKCYLVIIMSTIIVYGSYNSFVRYSVLGNYFMGRRKERADAAEQAFGLLALAKGCWAQAMVVGVVLFLLGELFQFNHQFRNNKILVESYVTRNSETLVSVGSMDGIRDRYGNTPLHAAAKRPARLRQYNPLPILLEHIGEVNVQNDFGRTALFNAVRTGNVDDAKLLIENGADLHLADLHGHTPAHVAAIKTGVKNESGSQHYFDILEMLIKSGADLQLKDYKGRTVVDCLQYFGARSLDEQ